ncbi:hypothetical protein MTR_0137s0030 [Medicago truncatula]|uniref:Uncharacterized protein n=1 Tax=Medicago truncatula TaxID=3880 RepID=A0A072TI48_MEDTR|nr:hypothetical protein MTR_0137s0030 [Medicago truncatula]
MPCSPHDHSPPSSASSVIWPSTSAWFLAEPHRTRRYDFQNCRLTPQANTSLFTLFVPTHMLFGKLSKRSPIPKLLQVKHA